MLKKGFIQGKEIGSGFNQKFEVAQQTEKIEVSFRTIYFIQNHAIYSEKSSGNPGITDSESVKSIYCFIE